VSVTDSGFAIRNAFIVGNGNSLATNFGGVRIDNAAGVTPQVFEHTTVANNAALAAADSAGVDCSTGTPLTATSSLVFLTVGGMATASGNCSWAYSNVEGGVPPALDDGNNIDADPSFVDVAEGDFHIQPGSPCIDAADPGSDVDVDFDGDARPVGDAPDIGADEVP
jgi:hypothetical protein